MSEGSKNVLVLREIDLWYLTRLGRVHLVRRHHCLVIGHKGLGHFRIVASVKLEIICFLTACKGTYVMRGWQVLLHP